MIARAAGRFVLHYVEMVIAMGAGMMLLYPLWTLATHGAGTDSVLRAVEVDSDCFSVPAPPVTLGLTRVTISTTVSPVERQPRDDNQDWQDLLAHRTPDELEAVVARFERAGVPGHLVSEMLQDGGDALFAASSSDDPEWATAFGGAMAVALLTAEISALAAHLNSRAASIRALAVDALLEDYSAVSVADELGVSRQKVYDIARGSQRLAPYIPHVPWRSHEHHD